MFRLGALLLTVATSLTPTTADGGPYNIFYYVNPGCKGTRFGCEGQNQLECCKAVPFLYGGFGHAEVTSDGAPGVVVFHDKGPSGECLGCTRTHSINRCIANRPFQPIGVINPIAALESLEKGGIELLDKELCMHRERMSPPKRDVPENHAWQKGKRNDDDPDSILPDRLRPKVCNNVNTVGIGNRSFKLDNLHVTEEFVLGVLDAKEGEEDKLVQKWGLQELVGGELEDPSG